MYIIDLTYTAPLEQVDRLLKAHIAFLDKQYEQGHFLASGRKVPRTGGIILALAASREVLEGILAEDPFHKEGLAEYGITEFVPSKTSDTLAFLKE